MLALPFLRSSIQTNLVPFQTHLLRRHFFHDAYVFASATDGTGATVRIVLLDYRKAFDLIDRQILVDKILSLRMPRGVAHWVCDFLSNRFQRVSSCPTIASLNGVQFCLVFPRVRPWLFLLMINDLNPPDAHSWKYVDDTTLAEVVQQSGQSHMQKTVTDIILQQFFRS